MNPGDHYHIVFATSGYHGLDFNTSVPPPAYPNFAGIAAADWIVTHDAYLAGYIPTWNNVDQVWKAILSSAFLPIQARTHINVQGPVYNTRGELVATGTADFWDGTIAHAIKYDEKGGEILSGFVWTGTDANGGPTGLNAGFNWENSNGYTATVGSPVLTNSGWIDSFDILSAGASNRLYGMSPLLTVPQPGDFNGDGKANAADYAVWRHSNGSVADYNLWRAHFGQSLPGSGSSIESAAVPEPSSLALLLVCVVILLLV